MGWFRIPLYKVERNLVSSLFARYPLREPNKWIVAAGAPADNKLQLGQESHLYQMGNSKTEVPY